MKLVTVAQHSVTMLNSLIVCPSRKNKHKVLIKKDVTNITLIIQEVYVQGVIDSVLLTLVEDGR